MKLSQDQVEKLKHYISKLKINLSGKFLFYCVPFRKKVVLKNMRQVFSEILTETEIQKLARAFYQHIFFSIKENLLLRFLSLTKLQRRTRIVGAEHLLQIDAANQTGAIIITGHFGNWEFAPVAGISHFPEYRGRLYFVRKLIGNKWIEKILFRRFYQAGLNVIPKHHSLEKVCETLENKNAVVFVLDQHAAMEKKDGIIVDFLGKPAATFKSPAMISRYLQVPILPARSYRDANHIHTLEFFAPLPWITHADSQQELLLNTRQYNEWLERFVLEYPEQWLWMHKRWKV